MNLFGKKKPGPSQPIAPPVDAIKDLRNQLLILEKRENFMNQRIVQTVQEAIRKKKGNDTKGNCNLISVKIIIIVIFDSNRCFI